MFFFSFLTAWQNRCTIVCSVAQSLHTIRDKHLILLGKWITKANQADHMNRKKDRKKYPPLSPIVREKCVD